jgi:cardiolipin synthase
MRYTFSRIIFFCSLFFTLNSISFANQQLIIEPDMGRAPLLNAIHNAKSSVDLVMYGLTDLQFVEALNQANAKHKSVKVLLQHYPYKADDENKIAITNLEAAKTPLQWPDNKFKLTHQKTLLIDDNYALIMTFNLTHSSFTKERNFALLITDPPIVQEIKNVFDADWQHRDITVHNSNLIWSPDNSREKLIALIQNAKTEIKMYAEGLNDYEIVGALAKAARNGVKITVLTSSFGDRPISKQFKYLVKKGVNILYSKDYVIHAKVIMIDQTRAVLGSINMTRQSINDNRELAMITEDTNIIHQLNQTFDNDLHHSTTTVVTPTAKPQSSLAFFKNMKEIMVLAKRYHRHAFANSRPHHRHRISSRVN